MKAFLTKNVAFGQHFSTKTADYSQHFKPQTSLFFTESFKFLADYSQHFKPQTSQILGLLPEKVWTKPDYNIFISNILQLSKPQKVWTVLSIA